MSETSLGTFVVPSEPGERVSDDMPRRRVSYWVELVALAAIYIVAAIAGLRLDKDGEGATFTLLLPLADA